MSTISMFGTCQNCGLVQYLQGQPCRDCGGKVQSGGRQPEAPCRTTSGAHCPGDGVADCKECPPEHVPPAGVDLVECDACPTSGGCIHKCMKAPSGREPEIQRWSAHWNMEEFYKSPHGTHVTYRDHRAHITRLQAEVERLEREAKNDLIAYKAVLERQNEIRAERHDLQSELTKARELLTFVVNSGGFSYKTVVKEIREFLSNQSAPADSGEV